MVCLFVRLSVRHILEPCHNGASYSVDHKIFTANCSKDSSLL